jgi:hypothetical protein
MRGRQMQEGRAEGLGCQFEKFWALGKDAIQQSHIASSCRFGDLLLRFVGADSIIAHLGSPQEWNE